jgi:hypothetical protein
MAAEAADVHGTIAPYDDWYEESEQSVDAAEEAMAGVAAPALAPGPTLPLADPPASRVRRWKPPVNSAGDFDPTAYNVDAAARDAIASLPQGSAEWLAARRGRLTASNFGAAAGRHGPAGRQALLKAMLWPETHAALKGRAVQFAAHGTKNEPVARDVYSAYRAHVAQNGLVTLWETGLLVSTEHGWLGASPDFVVQEAVPVAVAESMAAALKDPAVLRDMVEASLVPDGWTTIATPAGPGAFMSQAATGVMGPPPTGPKGDAGDADTVVVVTGCGEIKCPAGAGKFPFYSANPAHAATGGFPHYYYDQIQGAMALNGWPWCDVVVHTGAATQVKRFPANPMYWHGVLLPALRQFYFGEFVPRLTARLRGHIRRGHTDPELVLPSMAAMAVLLASPVQPQDPAPEIEGEAPDNGAACE